LSGIVAWLAARRAVGLGLALALMVAGVFAYARLPVEAVPDVSNNQVQVVTAAPALAANEVERIVTLPVERSMAGIPGLKQIRSISKLGLSLVTLVFRDDVDVYFARSQVVERLAEARTKIPESVGSPEIGPIATGLGEIYMFELQGEGRTAEELRTLLDWTIAPRLRQIRGVIEVVDFGGSVKQFRVTIDPSRLAAERVSFQEVREALARDNQTAGGGTIEAEGEQVALRGDARFHTIDDIRRVVVRTGDDGVPLTLGMLADVDTGAATRQGAMTADGKGEIVGGSVLLLKGENSPAVVARVKADVAKINEALPNGVKIVPFLDRSDFIERTVTTVVKNLLEGAAIVIVVLLLTLGSLRAGLLVAGAIPFSMLVAFIGLRALGMSANVMSLGAVDFGIVVEGAVVVAEAALHAAAHATKDLRRRAIVDACVETARPVLFAVAIVLLVFLPLGTLEDVEGKMFRPVVVSLVCMLMGALFYALVVVPALAPRLMAGWTTQRDPWLIRSMRRFYDPLVRKVVARPKLTIALAFGVTAACMAPLATMGAEFMPRIGEGASALDARRPVSTSITQAVALSSEAERLLLQIPEIARVVTRIGRTEGSIDPAGPESSDVFVIYQPRDRWRKGMTPEKLVAEMDAALEGRLPATLHAFSQPIEMRVNDMIAGVKSDVAVKIQGDDPIALERAGAMLRDVLLATPGAADVKMEATTGLPMMHVTLDREAAARLGVSPRSVLDAVEAVRAGQIIGPIYEGERAFDLVLRIGGDEVRTTRELGRLPIAMAGGALVPLEAVATIATERGPYQSSREDLRRRLFVEANVRGRDMVGFVAEARARAAKLQLPPGVEVHWGGQFENFTRAKTRLSLLLPIALAVIAGMLYAAYRSLPLMLVSLLSLPFALAGGVCAMWLRGLDFSIPAAVGFIALCGVSVMSGVVLTLRLLATANDRSIDERVIEAATSAFRPMISTALVAALGFVPMAIATSAGAEVQRPLATVVIGGLAVGVVLTSLAVPAMLRLVAPSK
jgi:cobalt-zinc-cadmium resistance protein CzcA